MWAPRASASTSSGCAYSRSIRSFTRRSRARSLRFAADLLLTCEIVPRPGSEMHRSTRCRASRTDRGSVLPPRRRLQLVDALRGLGLGQPAEVLGQLLTGLLRERLQVRAL